MEAVICVDILEQEIPVCVIWMEPVGGVNVLFIKAMLNEKALSKPIENFPGALLGTGTWEAQVHLPKRVTRIYTHPC